MKIYPWQRFFTLLVAMLLLSQTTTFAQIQTSANVIAPPEKQVEAAMSSVVLLLTGKGAGLLETVGSGVIVRSDGVILTAYHTVKNATQVQIRLKSGEIYDKVDLLAFDERRDVAALKIPATNLHAAVISKGETKVGEKIFVVSNPQSLTWTYTDGMLNAVRMADELPDAGLGFRVLQFSAPVSPGSSGGLLTNEEGLAIGLITTSITSGQNLNFAIPLASIEGLTNSTQVLSSFGNGNALELPQAVRPPSATEIIDADPKSILKNAKIFYVYSNSELISDKMMENALMKTPEFEKWNLVMIGDSKLADILINVEHDLFTFDYRYSMSDRRTNIILASGKVTVWDGKTASKKFAKLIVEKLKTHKVPSTIAEKTTEKK